MALISPAIRQQVIAEAQYCCEYCQTQQRLIGMPLVIDHIQPLCLGGSSRRDNLAASCYRCNQFKGAKTTSLDPLTNQSVSLFHPRHQIWFEHFAWVDGGLKINGLTATGRATVTALKLNNDYLVAARGIWISENWHPPNI
ncbi:MAG: HNH endonuclease [Nodosilinea sp.]